MIVYKIQNKINGKIYIGQTIKTLDERMKGHLLKKNNHAIHRAIKKYGIENFNFETMAYCDTRKHLNFLEKFYIGLYQCKSPNGYNLTDGGEGTSGHKFIDTKKFTENRKQCWRNPKYRENMAKKHWSKFPEKLEAVKNKISKFTKKMHEDGILGGYRGGGIKTEESRAKASASAKKKWSDPKYRIKMSEAHKGKKATEETKRKMSLAGKGRIVSEETGNKISDAKKRGWAKRKGELQCAAL